MKRLTTNRTLGAISLAVVFLFVSCSGEDPKEQTGFVDQVVDDTAGKIVNDVIDATFATAPVEIEPVNTVSDVGDILVHDSVMYAVFNGGIVMYDFRNNEKFFIKNSETFKAVALHGDQIFVGGDKLYTLFNRTLKPVTFEFEGSVSSLYGFEHRLLVGTDRGLYSNSIFGDEQLMDDVSVTAMVSDGGGVWVATDGKGLYRWDGDVFRRRYLIRDTTIFDNVNALDFNHGHLYIGAATGFFVYDGGRWEHWTVDLGLPTDTIKAIDASSWMVYVGSDKGVISYFDKNIYPVKKLEETVVGSMKMLGQKLIVGTDNDGIVMKAGQFVKTLVEPVSDEKEEVFSKSEDETI